MPLALILTYLPQIISAGTSLITFVTQIRSAAQQSSEWTDDHEAQFLAMLAAQATQPEQQLE